jgi:DNA-binding NtrC family response regulator
MATPRTLLCLLPDSSFNFKGFEQTTGLWLFEFAGNLAQAANILKNGNCQVGLICLGFPLNRTKEIVPFLRQHDQLQWIAIIREADLENSQYRSIMLEYMYDYHTLPIDYDRLSFTIGHAHGYAQLHPKKSKITKYYNERKPVLIGESKVMQKLRTQVKRVSRVSAPVLLSGETGTGKEIVARTIHSLSSRAGFPFIAINCLSLAPNLIHSQLFGFERGAFTDAKESKPGLLEIADKGTVFLDGIADLPISMQAILLRFLQEKTVRRLGGRKDITIDVRIIAATHVNIENAVFANTFREDLYYRLAVLPIKVPALRERLEDIELLSAYFYRQFRHERAPQIKGFSSATIEEMLHYSWPGNVRELLNRTRRALALAEGKLIRAVDLGLPHSLEIAETVTLKKYSSAQPRNLSDSLLETVTS